MLNAKTYKYLYAKISMINLTNKCAELTFEFYRFQFHGIFVPWMVSRNACDNMFLFSFLTFGGL